MARIVIVVRKKVLNGRTRTTQDTCIQERAKSMRTATQAAPSTWKGTPRRHKYDQFFEGMRIS